MSFDYRKNKEGSHADSFWTSYSDLFLGLSTIFLLLYVVSSLRNGTEGIRSMIENKRLSTEVQDLKNQIQAYEAIRSDYMKKEASQSEIQEYTELMDKLTLLQEEAKDENERLMREAMENKSKEAALNKYQQMVRNVINANKLAKTKITSRDDIIGDQDQELSQLDREIQEKKKLIEEGDRKIAEANATLEKKIADLDRARKNNKLTAKKYRESVEQLKAQNENQISALEEKNSAYQKQLAETQSQLQEVGGQLRDTEGKLIAKQGEAEGLKKQVGGLSGQLQSTKGQLDSTRGELAKAKAELDARKMVAKEIKSGLARAGVKADVDMQSGEVVIDFGDAYFKSDSAKLNEQMKNILQKAMPAYSKSLLGNPKIANKISAVEVIGFASPIYQGKYINPHSSDPKDREALKYNMDLSYRRANAIFKQVVDGKSMDFEYQNELIPLMKVSGRSFLEVFKTNRDIASSEDFCKVNDCKKTQRVIIRFSMDNKK